MESFENFSKEIDTIIEKYKRGRFVRFLLWVEYHRLRRRNQPLPFIMLEEGEPVGESMDVYHLSLHDIMPHAVRVQLTAEVLLKGRRINTFSREAYKQMEGTIGRTTIQPRWLESTSEPP